MIWRLMSGPARSALVNYTASVSREIAQYGVNINNILPGMFATEGSEENAVHYAKAFGLEMDNDVIAEHFNAHNKIPAGFAAIADDMAPMAALLCSPPIPLYRGTKYCYRWWSTSFSILRKS